MSAKEQMEKLIGVLGEATDVAKERQGDNEVQWDEIKEKVEETVKAMMIIRKGDNTAASMIAPSGIITEGKFSGYSKADLQLTATILRQAHAERPIGVKLPSETLIRALDTDSSGAGAELVFTDLARSLWRDFFLTSRITGNLGAVAMPTDPFKIPLELGDVTWRKGTQNTSTTASNPATSDVTLTTTEQVAEINWSYTLDEDSVIAMLPALRDRLRISGAEQFDAFVLNADATDAATGNINLDDANPDNDKYYLSDGQDGIRHQWLVDNTTQEVNAGGNALVDADLLDAQSNMGKYGVNPERMMQICDVSTYLKGYLGLDGVTTLDKYGSRAVLITGELANYRGIPIVISASAPLTEADGKVSETSGSNTLGQISIVNRDFWQVGLRRDLMMEVARDIQKRQFILVISFRIAVAAFGTRSTITHTAGVRNILV